MKVSGTNLNIGRQRKIIFHGNSLFSLHAGVTTDKGRYLETSIYNLIKEQKPGWNASFLSFSGNPTTTKIANWSTQTLPIIKEGDIVILWEIQNDVSANGLTGQQAFDKLVEFADLVHEVGAYIIVGTATARDHAADTTQFTRNSDCNTLLRADHSAFDGFVDVGATSGFAIQEDCSGVNYQADKLHFSTTGSDTLAPVWATGILNSGLL